MVIKSDGNGGWNINKQVAIIITIMIFLLGSATTFAYSYGMSNNRMDNFEDEQNDILDNNKDINDEIDQLKHDDADLALNIAVLTTKIEDLTDAIDKLEQKIN